MPALRPSAARRDEAPKISFLPGGAVSFDTPPLPPRQWSNTLTNGGFGCLVSDTGPDVMWLQNARECPLTPWRNDPVSTAGGEVLEAVRADGRKSLFADGINRCRVIHGFGWTRWETDAGAVTAFIPEGKNARVLMVEGCEGMSIFWRLPVTMTPNAADAP